MSTKIQATKKRKGFSLVEILIVLVILAVISGGGMMIAGKSSDKAKYVTAQKDLDIIQQAFIQYYNVVGSYEGIENDKDLSAAFTGNHNTTPRIDILQSFLGKTLASWADPWGNQYQVKSNLNATTGQGVIVVVCTQGTGAAYAAGSIGTLTVGNIRSDTMSNAAGTEMPMLRIIYNVTF